MSTENDTAEGSGSLSERLESEGIHANQPSGEFSGELSSDDEPHVEPASFIIRSDSHSVKQMISLLAETSQPMLNISKVLKSSTLLSRLIWSIVFLGICLVWYQNIISTPDSALEAAQMNIMTVILITCGLVVIVVLLDFYITKTLMNSFFRDQTKQPFIAAFPLSLVGLLLLFTGLGLGINDFNLSSDSEVFMQTDEIATGLSLITADQALSVIPIALYMLGALVGIAYMLQGFVGARIIAKNAVDTDSFSEVMQSKYIKVMAQN